MNLELFTLWSAVVAYVASGSLAIFGVVFRRRPDLLVLGLMTSGLVLHTAAIAIRWERVGHGPYTTMFEILSSNLWSLTLVFAIAYWRLPAVRPVAALVMPVLFMMMGWMLLQSPAEGHLPATYDTIWLYIHIILGKVFLGAVLVAVGLGSVILLRSWRLAPAGLAFMPDDASLDELAYRFLALGLIFDSLMLVAGAIWAQDAWGRYWAWDPLETWAFITWLLLAFTIHLRFTFKPDPRISAMLSILVFVVAFLTFFGVPFLSQAPHKGAI